MLIRISGVNDFFDTTLVSFFMELTNINPKPDAHERAEKHNERVFYFSNNFKNFMKNACDMQTPLGLPDDPDVGKIAISLLCGLSNFVIWYYSSSPVGFNGLSAVATSATFPNVVKIGELF